MRSSSSWSCWRLTRAGGIDPNPTTYAQRSGQFASAATLHGSATLLLTRIDGTSTGWLLTADHPSASDAAMALAATVAARVERADPPDLSGTAEQATMVTFNRTATYRETLNGQDPAEFSRQMAVAMRDGEWVAATLRAPSRGESNRHRSWVSARMGGSALPTHHSLAPGAVVMTVRAGSTDGHGRAAALLAAVGAAMPGFDVATRAHRVPTRGRVVVTAAALAAAAWGVPRLAGAVESLRDLTSHVSWWPAVPGAGWLVGLLLGAYAALAGWGLVPVPGDRTRAATAGLRFAAPPRRLLPARRKKVVRGQDGVPREVREADYPLARSSFLVGPQVMAGLVAPHAGAASGQSATADRVTPAVLAEPIGPLLGVGADGRAVHVCAGDMLFGVGLLGRPGSGKSQLVRSLFAWTLAERLNPSGRDGFPGAGAMLVAFESKGDGAQVYADWGHTLGYDPVVIEVADPGTPAINLFDIPGAATVRERAEFFANALKYAEDNGAIQDRSFDVAVRVFTAALALTPALAATVEGVDPDGSPVYFAHLLLGNEGDKVAVALAAAVISEAVRREGAGTPDVSLSLARKELVPIYQDRTEAQRRGQTEALANKVSQLMAAEDWWRRAAAHGKGWGELLEAGHVLVVNTGVSRAGRQVEDQLSRKMSALLMFGLRHAIQRTCSGWNERGRSVCLFADELSLLAGSSAEVVTWLRNQGRSYGVRPVLATQYPDQLNQQVRDALMGFSTMVAFAQDAGKTANDVAADAAADGSDWAASDVVNLPRFSAIMRTNVDQSRVPACTVKVTFFEGDMDGFVAAQGGALSAPPRPAPTTRGWGW